MSRVIRRGLAGVLLSVVAFCVGWALLYGSGLDGGALLLIGSIAGFLISLLFIAAGLIRGEKANTRD